MNIQYYKSLFSFMLFSYIDDGGAGGEVGDSGSGDDDGDGSGDGGAGEGGSGDDTGIEGKWPDNWRETIANGDEKIMGQLGRYATPTDIWNKARSLEQRLSSGELKTVTPFPEKGTDEQKAEWRAENGIPAEPKYDLKMPEGFVIGEADQPVIDGFMEYAHSKNMSPEAVNASVEWYFENQEKAAEARNEMDLEFQEKNTDELRAEWGNDYRANLNRVHGLLDTAPEGVKDALMSARMADGNPLASDVNVLKFLTQLAHEINPATTLVPGSGANVMNAIGDEIASLEAMMADRSSEYWKGPKAEKNQDRYRKLVAARDKAA